MPTLDEIFATPATASSTRRSLDSIFSAPNQPAAPKTPVDSKMAALRAFQSDPNTRNLPEVEKRARINHILYGESLAEGRLGLPPGTKVLGSENTPQAAMTLLKEPVGIVGDIAGATGNALYHAAEGVAGLGTAAVSPLFGEKYPSQAAARVVNVMQQHQPHPLSALPSSKLFGLAAQHVFEPGIQKLGQVTGQPTMVQDAARAAQDIGALLPLTSAFRGAVGEGIRGAGEVIGNSLRGKEPLAATKEGFSTAADAAARATGVPQFAEGVKKALAPRTEAEVASKMRKYITRLGDMPTKLIRDSGDPVRARQLYGNREALATDEMLQQASKEGITPKEYAKSVDVSQEAKNISGAKDNLFKEYNQQLADAAASGAVVPVKPLLDYWREQLGKRVNRENKLEPFIQDKIRTLTKEGDYNLPQAQEEIKSFNSSSGKATGPRQEYKEIGLESGANKILRNELDNSIETLGPQYQDLKNRYAALKQHEDLVSRALTKHLKATDIKKGSFLDAIAGIEGIRGLAKLDPNILTTALAAEGVSFWRRLSVDANRALRGLYDVRASKFESRQFYEPGTATGRELPPTQMTPPSTEGVAPKTTRAKTALSADRLAELHKEYPNMTIDELVRLQAGESPEAITQAVRARQSAAEVRGGIPRDPFATQTPEVNASLESPASLEATRELASRQRQGIKTEIVDTRSGKSRPAIGVRPEDNPINPHDELVRIYPDGRREILKRGPKARSGRTYGGK